MYVLGMTAIGIVMQRANPELMAERAKWRRKDTKGFDKLFLAAMLPLATVQPFIAGMDAVRFRWSSLGFAWVYPGVIVFALAMFLMGWAVAVNRHAETTVRIQTDRGHTVVTWGPYRFVRHPMYVGAILMYVGTPLVWGSVAASVDLGRHHPAVCVAHRAGRPHAPAGASGLRRICGANAVPAGSRVVVKPARRRLSLT